MKKKRWASYCKRLVKSGVVDPSELSEMVGVSVETARNIINRYASSEQDRQDFSSDHINASEEVIDVSPREKLRGYYYSDDDKRLSKLRLGYEISDAIPSTWDGLPIYRYLAKNLLDLESLNADATVDYENYLATWLNRERSKLKLDRYLNFFGLRSEDLPISPADLRDAMSYLANNEEYTQYSTKHLDPPNVERTKYRLPNDTFYLKGTLANPSVVEYSHDGSYILDFALQTDIFLEDPNSDQPWMLFSREKDYTIQNDIRRRLFTFVGAQGILEDFCTQQLLWTCRSFPEMLDSDIRVFGDPEITPIKAILDATLP